MLEPCSRPDVFLLNRFAVHQGAISYQAILLQALFLGGTAFGGLLGGWIGDIAARFYPNHGRILATQFSVVAGVPFSLVLLKASRAQPEDKSA